ncbi:hypothetical protein JZ751_027614 [Albula glossodonta]|uniref:Pentraxin family member n=1 Tax=Albula glossodonta TaxID=121402 RepID=A0A8T2NJI2_9TELE|nr:hypothetical protein JZ751_027614 [Albula glossodonta]
METDLDQNELENKALRNLTGRAFIFPVESTAHVKLTPDVTKIFFAVTVCLRFMSDLSRVQSMFSLATQSYYNGFLMENLRPNVYRIYVSSGYADFSDMPDNPNGWNSFCGTWDAGTGLTQAWVNGRRSTRKGAFAGGSLTVPQSIVLGQDQDSFGGGFDVKQSFIGELTDVHMWDYVLPPSEIQRYMNGGSFSNGNVINWQALEYTTDGYVVVDKVQ